MIERPYERACRTFAKFVYLSYSPASCCEIAISPTAREVAFSASSPGQGVSTLNLLKTPFSQHYIGARLVPSSPLPNRNDAVSVHPNLVLGGFQMSFSSGRIIPYGPRGFAILLFIGHISIACAQKARVPEKLCGDYGTQSEMNDCAAREAHKADAALNSTYKKLLIRLGDDKTATARVVAA